MNKVNVAILRAAGCNCDVEAAFAFELAGADARLIHINQLLSGDAQLDAFQILAIPGGFTYGDDVSAGKILANELKYQLTEQLYQFYEAGKLILGICNGFQVLVKSGLLPQANLTASEPEATLTYNDSGKYEDRWVYMKINPASSCLFIQNMPEVIYIPVAHSEGKFVPRDDEVLAQLQRNNQVVFQYCDQNGNEVEYPGNPNGSIAAIAGICDPSGRILGLMPHPERYIHPTHHPRWTREGLDKDAYGRYIFENAVNYMKIVSKN